MREPSALRLWSRRAVRRRALLSVIALAVAVLAGLAIVATAFAVRAPTVIARDALRDAAPGTASVAITATGDPAAEDRAFRPLVARAFGDAPVRVERTVSGRRTTWTITPVVERIRASQLGDLEHGFRTLPGVASIRFGAENGTTTRGSGVALTSTLRSSAEAVTEVIPVPMTILAVAGAVALGMLGRLLVAARTAEDRLLRARGASGRQLVRIALAEAAVVTAVGVVVGGAIGTAATLPAWGAPTVAQVAIPVVAAFVLAVVTVGIAAWSAVARRVETVGTRTTVAVSGAVVLLLLAVAAVAVWRYRDPSSTAATRAADPLAVIAPAAALTALGVAAAVLLGPILTAIAAVTARGAGLVAPLATRLAARDIRVLATPATLLTLAVAAGALAAGSNGTTTAFLQDSGRIAAGAALRASVGGSVPLNAPSDLVPAVLRSGAAQRDGITPVLRFAGSTPTDSATVIGVDASALPALQPVARQLFDAHGTARALGSTTAGIALGTGRFRIALATSAGAGSTTSYDVFGNTVVTPSDTGSASVSLTAWVADAQGDLAPVTTGGATVDAGSSGSSTVSATLPDGGPWRLVALDVRSRGDVDLADATIRVTGLSVGGRAVGLPTDRWTVAGGAYDAVGFRTGAVTGVLGVATPTLPGVPGSAVGVRLMPGGARDVAVAVSRDLATSAGLHVGDTFDVSSTWAGFRARVAAVVPVVPGTTGSGILADLASLDRGALAGSQRPARIREVWAASESSRATLERALPGAGIAAPTTTTEAGFVALSTGTLLLGAGGGLLFAVLALAASVVTLGRERDDEARGLRASGVTPRAQAGARSFGPSAVVVHGVVAGLVAGLCTFLLVVPTTARTSAPTAPAALPVHDAFDGLVLAVAVGVALVAGAAVVAVQSVRIGRAARTAGSGVER